jgi:ABC-type polysaccharide/polyol phosphate export permease
MTTTARRRGSLWTYRSLVWSFAQRDLKSRFKGTALGWIWSLAFPMATLFTYTVVFAVIFKSVPPALGNGQPGSFPVWLFSGLVPWSFFLVSINVAIPTLLANGGLLQKVYFPSFAPVIGAVLAILVQSLIETGILLAALLLLGNVGPTWLLYPEWLVLFVVFVNSVALSLSIVNVYFRDVAHLVNVALQLLFFLTPIIYTAEAVPESWHGIPLRALVMANPIAQFIEALRAVLYGLTVPTWANWLGMLAWTGIALAVCIGVYRRWGLDIGESV